MAGVKLSHWQKLTQPAILSLSCSNWRIVTKWVGHHGKVWPCGCLVSCFFWTSLGPQKTQPFGGWDPKPLIYAGTSNVEVNHILMGEEDMSNCQITILVRRLHAMSYSVSAESILRQGSCCDGRGCLRWRTVHITISQVVWFNTTYLF